MADPGSGVGVTSRVSKVTLSKWLKVVSDQAKRKFALLPILQAKGRVKTVDGGGDIAWPIQYKDHNLVGHLTGLPREYQPLNELEVARLPWAAYEVSDVAYPLEIAQNGGEAKIVDIFKKRSALMQKSAVRKIGRQFYNDKDVAQAAIPNPFHGIESMMSLTGQSATDQFQTTSNDTYAGIGTSRTSLKANAVAGDDEYGAWTPVIVNCNRTVNGSAVPWSANADQYVSDGLAEAAITDDDEDQVDYCLFRKQKFQEFKQILKDKERVQLTGEHEARAYGFKPNRMVLFEGANCTWDAGCPSSDASGHEVIGYGFNTDQIELMLLDVPGGVRPKDGLFALTEFRDPFTMGWLWRLVCFGQLKFNPRHQLKFSKMAA